MATTPRPVIHSVVRSLYGRQVERLVALPGGGLHETYRRGRGTATRSPLFVAVVNDPS